MSVILLLLKTNYCLHFYIDHLISPANLLVTASYWCLIHCSYCMPNRVMVIEVIVQVSNCQLSLMGMKCTHFDTQYKMQWTPPLKLTSPPLKWAITY